MTGRKLILQAIGMLILAFVPLSAHAASESWDGDTNQDWNTASNWSNNAFPSGGFPAGVATINLAAGNFPIITANQVFTPSDVVVGRGTSGRVDHRAGNAFTGNGNWAFIGEGAAFVSGVGTYNLANTAAGGGTLTGFGLGSGNLTIGGGSATSGRIYIGRFDSSVGTFNMNTSGTLTVENDDVGMFLGDAGSATGNFNLDAGIVNINSLAGNLAVLVATNGADGNFRMSGGDVNITGRVWLGDNNSNSNGLLQMSGGTFDANGIEVGRTNGHGSINMTGGTLTTPQLFIARGTAAGNTGTGSVSVGAGATLNVSNELAVGYAGNGPGGALGTMDVAGTVKLTGGVFNIGVFDNVRGTLNINAGADIQMHNNTIMRFGVVGGSTTVGVVNHNAGNVTFYSDGGVTVGGTGFLNMQEAGAGSHTYNLNGGTLTVSRIDSNANGGSRIFNFNGGTLKATRNEANFVAFNTNGGAGSNRANIRNGGAIVDSNGFSITIARTLDHSNIGGDNAIDGGLTKIGAGTLTLSGLNTYTGPTNVDVGTLALSHASNNNIAQSNTINVASGANLNVTGLAGAADLILASGQTLKGAGVVTGSVTAGPGSTIAPGTSIESLGITGAIGFNQGTFAYEMNTSSVTADLLFGSTGTTLDLDNNPILNLIDLGTNAKIPGNKFTLISYDGLWDGGTFAGFADDSFFFFAGNDWLINYNDLTPGSNFVGDTNNSSRFVTISAVPEPGSLSLAALFVLAMSLYAWRQRRGRAGA